jgi:hypothetical protein
VNEMALILKKENNNYQKILLNQCFINKDGLYISTIVFKNKSERDKDKSREIEIESFKNNIYELFEYLKQFENQSEENITDEVKSKISDYIFLNYIYNNLKKVLYNYEGLKNEMLNLNNKQKEILIENSFKVEWYNDPVILIREDEIWAGEYNKQDFTLESFYESLKNNVYTDLEGNLLVEDDL